MPAYKGNLHTHTTASDGKLTPDQIADLYKFNGYDFLIITDHWKLSKTEYHKNGLLLISGIEYNFGQNVQEGVFHVVGIGMKCDPNVNRNDTPESAVEKIHSVEGLADIAHPAWSMNTVEQLKRMKNADFTEIYNSVSDLPANCRPYSGDVLDKLAADENGKLFPLAAVDDSHWCNGEECKSFIYVQAEYCTPENILENIKKGNFLASQGPTLNVTQTEDGIIITCPPEDKIVTLIYFTDAVWTPNRTTIAPPGEYITKSVFHPTGTESYVRIEATSASGKKAWSQYIKLK